MLKNLLVYSGPLALVIYIGTFIVITVEAQSRSASEVVQRQIEIEKHLASLDSITTRLSDQGDDHERRISQLEGLSIPATLAEIRKTVEFDHMLMWFIACSVGVVLVETVGRLTLSIHRGRGRRGEV